MINSTHGAFRRVFEIWGLIPKSRKTPWLACNQLSNSSGAQAGGKVFQNMGINPQILKTLVLLCKGSAQSIQMSELKCSQTLYRGNAGPQPHEAQRECVASYGAGWQGD